MKMDAEATPSTSQDGEKPGPVEFAIKMNDIIEKLISKNDLKALDDTLRSLEPFDDLKDIEGVRAACAVMAFERGAFDELNEILQSINFDPRWHSHLQRLWYGMHYKIAEKIQGKTLGAVARYRLRKKHPLPRTIWDGEKITHNIKDSSRNMMSDFYTTSQYPSYCEKMDLAKRTGLTMKQIGNWFKNKRARNRSAQKKLIILEHARCAELLNQQAAYSGNVENALYGQVFADDGNVCAPEGAGMVGMEVVQEQAEVLGERPSAAISDSPGEELRNAEIAIFPEMNNVGNESNVEQGIIINEEMINREREKLEEELRMFERKNLLERQKAASFEIQIGDQNEVFTFYTLELGDFEISAAAPAPCNSVLQSDLIESTTPNGLGQPPDMVICQNMQNNIGDSDQMMEQGTGLIECSLNPINTVETNGFPRSENFAELRTCPPYQNVVDESLSHILAEEYSNAFMEPLRYQNEFSSTNAEVRPETSSEVITYQPTLQQCSYIPPPDFFQFDNF